MTEFCELANKTVKTSIGFDIVSRGFGFYETIASIVLMGIGMALGVEVLHQSNTGNYGVAVVYLVKIS